MSAIATAERSVSAEARTELRSGRREPPARPGLAGSMLVGTVVAALLCLATFLGESGLNIERSTVVELLLTLLAGVSVAAAVLLAPVGRRIAATWPIALLLALSGLAAASISWSVAPNASWQEASMMLSYASVFVAAAAVARAAPARIEAVLGGIVAASAIVSGYALLSKVFPGEVGAYDAYARLIGPFGYWNATGLAAGMGIVASLWLGSRRSGHGLLRALAYPAMGLLMVTLMLAYSRGALIVTAIGVALWLCVVPLRLRAAALLIAAGACAAGVIAFDFAKASLSAEGVALAIQRSGGRELGVLLLALLLALLAIGVLVVFATDRRRPSAIARRRAGAALLAALALAALAVLGGLAASHRGLVGTISHAVSSVTNPNAPVPLANTPNRLTAVSSVRARYWKEAIEVFEGHPALGAGAGGYAVASERYRPANLVARNAHGYLVETLANLGALGLALTLLLLVAWAVAAGAATHPFNRRWRAWRWSGWPARYTPERIALLSALCIVATFGLHSLADWTWYAPGVACVALICAGWLAGRGPLHEPEVQPEAVRWRHLLPGRASNLRLAGAGAAIALALLAAWVEWQPALSYEESQSALELVYAGHPQRALAEARSAVKRDPLSAQAQIALAATEEGVGRRATATATLKRVVREQPANPETWFALGRHELASDPRAAVSELGAALYLSPQDVSYQDEYARAAEAAKTGGAQSQSQSQSRR
ncbi:MAG: tetratricopeptide repeat protein [Solirubrobacteraceae bacterium]